MTKIKETTLLIMFFCISSAFAVNRTEIERPGDQGKESVIENGCLIEKEDYEVPVNGNC